MIDEGALKEIVPTGAPSTVTAAHVVSGLPMPKPVRVKIFSPDDWEQFAEEYATSLKADYAKVRRFAGAGDMGVDIAGFVTDKGFSGG